MQLKKNHENVALFSNTPTGLGVEPLGRLEEEAKKNVKTPALTPVPFLA